MKKKKKKKLKPKTKFQKWLCENKMCKVCKKFGCSKKKYGFKSKSYQELQILHAIKKADIDIWLDSKKSWKRKNVKKLMKELKYIEKLMGGLKNENKH